MDLLTLTTAVPVLAALVALSAFLLVLAAILLMLLFHRQNKFSLQIVEAHRDILDRLLDMMEQRVGKGEYLAWPAAPEDEAAQRQGNDARHNTNRSVVGGEGKK